MIFTLFLQAFIAPEIIELRAEHALQGWQGCVSGQAFELLSELDETQIDNPVGTVVDMAKIRCYVMGQDFKRSLADVVQLNLKKDGATRGYGFEMIDMLVGEAFSMAETRMLESIKNTIAARR